MIAITEEDIKKLNISPLTCVNWVEEAFKLKYECQLPAKVSVHPAGNDFITTMPCLLPPKYHTFGVKVVSRINGNHPALKSDLMLFDTRQGTLKAIVETDWITSMRTGAVATLAIRALRKSNTRTYSFIGLGNTAHATMKCMLETFKDEHLEVRLFRYKEQAEKFMADFSRYTNVSFHIVDSMKELTEETDVLISCITDAQGLLVEDTSWFAPGVLLVPIHTRGFQNCDLIFDKVFADDTDHVKGFKYFSQFKQFNEIGNVLKGTAEGRLNDTERIISYNIGLGLHDVYYSHQIYNMLHP
ncbi:MAG: ornithine cyclodeaminase [Bacteroides sp.]|nr:ornithine cyclodeaminase [Bacteroides sp.]